MLLLNVQNLNLPTIKKNYLQDWDKFILWIIQT